MTSQHRPRFADFTATLDHQPTAEQAQVIESEAPAILVVAGAGSGKTATMSQRIAWHIVNGKVKPHEVLGLTFTRKAAGELAERVAKQIRDARFAGLLDWQANSASGEVLAGKSFDHIADEIHAETFRPTVSTYNSFASDIASSYAMLIGEDPRARLITDAERWEIMAQLVAEHLETQPVDSPLGEAAASTLVQDALSYAAAIVDNDLSVQQVRDFLMAEADAVAKIFDPTIRAKRGTTTPMSSLGQDKLRGADAKLRRNALLLDIVEKYFAYKKAESIIEFADQVANARRILHAVPEVGEQLRARYKLILLDEYQDTSINQAQFLHAAFGQADSVCAVGDPNQAIYNWRGASEDALGDFARKFRVQPQDMLTLSTAFRNGEAILDAANALTSEVEYRGINVETLHPRPGAPSGAVTWLHRHLRDDVYTDLAERLTTRFAQAPDTSVAVLCRKRSYMEPIEAALEAAGIPCERVGGEAIIEKPEIQLVRSLLRVVVNPNRNDELLPLLNFFALGARDLRALSSLSDLLAQQADQEPVFSLALEAIRTERKKYAGMFTPAGCVRLCRLAEIMHRLRDMRHLPLPDVLTRAINELDLPSYAAARTQGGTRVRNALAGFVRFGHEFAAQNPLATLAGFLDRMDLVEEREHGGEGESSADLPLLPEEEIEPESGIVQLLTVHASKGLEWDVVVVPGLNPNDFDSISTPKSWHTTSGMMPYPLRLDRDHLPIFEATTAVPGDMTPELKISVLESFGQYYATELANMESEEHRRLAYVAITRPRDELIIPTYDFADEDQAKKALAALEKESFKYGLAKINDFRLAITEELAQGSDTPFTQPPRVDMRELTSTHSVDVDRFTAWAGTLRDSVDEPAATLRWPADVDRSLDRTRTKHETPASNPQTYEGKEAGNSVGADTAALISRWERSAKLLQQAPAPRPEITGHLTASDVVNLSRNPKEFMRNRIRPIPTRPSRAARTGITVHAAIAHHFDSPATLDIDSVADPDEMPIDMAGALTDEDARKLIARFEEAPFAECPPIAVEQALEIELLGMPVRCVIDAVLDTSGMPGHAPVTIVDWKTGRHPSGSQVRHRALQLALYRLVWATANDLPLENIDACFYYLGEDDPKRRLLKTGQVSREAIEQQIEDLLHEGTKSK